MWWLITIAGLGLFWIAAVQWNRRAVQRFDGSGDPEAGMVVFVEPVQWLFIIWGFAGFVRGLRRHGGRRQVHLFRWSKRAGALLVLPDLCRHDRLLVKADRLARFVDGLAAEHPEATIHLCGYSSGCYLIAQAVPRLQFVGDANGTARLGQVLFLAGTISPDYDLDPLLRRVQAVHSFHSRLDMLINGLGPALFGCNDRRRALACGMVGFRSRHDRLVQHGWRLGDVVDGWLGDHFTLTRPRFVARHMAPCLGPSASSPQNASPATEPTYDAGQDSAPLSPGA